MFISAAGGEAIQGFALFALIGCGIGISLIAAKDTAPAPCDPSVPTQSAAVVRGKD